MPPSSAEPSARKNLHNAVTVVAISRGTLARAVPHPRHLGPRAQLLQRMGGVVAVRGPQHDVARIGPLLRLHRAREHRVQTAAAAHGDHLRSLFLVPRAALEAVRYANRDLCSPARRFRPIISATAGRESRAAGFSTAVASSRSARWCEIGDDATLNEGSVMQPHSLEEGAFKSDWIRIGKRASLGPSAFVHYGVVVGDGADRRHRFVRHEGRNPSSPIRRGAAIRQSCIASSFP